MAAQVPASLENKYPEASEATHTFLSDEKPIILLEHFFDLEVLEALGAPILSNIESCGIRGYFNVKEHVIPGLIKMFYENLKIGNSGFVGTVLGTRVVVTPASIAQAIGCECVSTSYHKNWVSDIGGLTKMNKVLLKEGEPLSGTLLYSRLNDTAKVYQQILNKGFLHKQGGKDNLSDVHKFCLYHMLTGVPFNLPDIIFNHWKLVLSDRREFVYHTMVLNRILWDCKVYHKYFELSDDDKKVVHAHGKLKLLPITFGKSNLNRMNLSFRPPQPVQSKPRKPSKKTTAPAVQQPNPSDEEDNEPIAMSLKRRASVSATPAPAQGKRLRIQKGKLTQTETDSESLSSPPVSDPRLAIVPASTSSQHTQTVMPTITFRLPHVVVTSLPVIVRRRDALLSYDLTSTSRMPTTAPPPRRHPLLPPNFPDHTNVYTLIFPGSANPTGKVEVADPLKYLYGVDAKNNKIGNRQKPNPHIGDKSISILCDLYPITWPGRYMIQKPGNFQLGYYRPLYSWINEGAEVVDEDGTIRRDADGNPLRYETFYSSRPTFGPEYYYLPSPPPPPPSFAVMIKPPLTEPPRQAPALLPLDDRFRSSSLPDLHPPHGAINDDFRLQLLQAVPPEEYSYDEGYYDPPSDGMLTTASEASISGAVVPLPRPKYRRRIISRVIFRDYLPWSPPQGTVQWVKPLHPGPLSPHFEPKVPIFDSRPISVPIPAATCKSLTSLEIAIFGFLKLYLDIPNKFFVPPSLHITDSTNILLLTDRLLPDLPLINPNKLKDPLPKLPPKPAPSTFSIHPVEGERRKQSPEFATHASELDAEQVYHRFMYKCSMEAGSSGLSQDDKQSTPTVAKCHMLQQSDLYHFTDSSVALLHQSRGAPDLELLSREYFIHPAMFNLHAYQAEWKAVTDAWPRISPPPSPVPAPSPIPVAPLAAALPAPEIAASSGEGSSYVTEAALDSRLQQLQASISQQVQDQFQQLMALMASRFPPPPPPS